MFLRDTAGRLVRRLDTNPVYEREEFTFGPFERVTIPLKDGFVLEGIKSLVPLAAQSELFIVAAQLEGSPALFIVEAGTAGLSVQAEPAMGLRAASTVRAS